MPQHPVQPKTEPVKSSEVPIMPPQARGGRLGMKGGKAKRSLEKEEKASSSKEGEDTICSKGEESDACQSK